MFCSKYVVRIVTSFAMLLIMVTQTLTTPAFAQTIDPTSVTIPGSSAVCSGSSETIPVSITLPGSAITNKVDVFLLFDDTGSFAGFVPTVQSIFSNLVTSLETTLPGVEFGFGVGRFEDYGGPGTGFSSESTLGRPFILNQPIVTAVTAGSSAARNTLISTALARSAPGGGGDGPESAIAEGLYQVATGFGFDGDGNGSALDSGPAGAATTQTSPGTSGDVPPFSSNAAPTSGSLGGVGWRTDSLRLVILATDIASIAAFPAGSPIPSTITGAGGTSEPVSAFAYSSVTPGANRFGYVSDAKSRSLNTVTGAVVPAGAGTVQATVNALNALGIRVLGMGPGAAPTNSAGPSSNESVFLSALARLTGAVDASGSPLVFSTAVSLANLTTAIANAISTSATAPVDISLTTSTLPAGLSFSFTPPVVNNVAPGGTASFVTTLTGDGSAVNGSFEIRFVDVASGAVLGTLPVTVDCQAVVEPIGLDNTAVSGYLVTRTPAPNAPAGQFNVTGTFENISTSAEFEKITFRVLTLTNGNLLLNTDSGVAGGVGAELTVPISAFGPDGILSPGESFDVTYEIGLAALRGFTFLVEADIDLVGGGTIIAPAAVAQKPQYQMDFAAEALEDDTTYSEFIYLPVVVR